MLGSLLLLAAAPAGAFTLPEGTRQLIVGRAESWEATEARLQRWERDPAGGAWRAVGVAVPARLGRNGLAWGRGLHPAMPGLQKKESDGRAPAGVFAVGGAFGDEADVPRHPALPYRRVTPADLWVEDAESPHYNRHLVLPDGRAPATDWERKQQMKQGDPAHKLKLFIAHNAGADVQPGAGSAIFFHIWREGGGKPSTGCTVMDEAVLREWIGWIDPSRQPLYVLLPEEEYAARRAGWKLP